MAPMAVNRPPSTARATSSCTTSGLATVVFAKTTVGSWVAGSVVDDDALPEPGAEAVPAERGPSFSSRAADPAPVPASDCRRVRLAGPPVERRVGAEVLRFDVDKTMRLRGSWYEVVRELSEYASRPGNTSSRVPQSGCRGARVIGPARLRLAAAVLADLGLRAYHEGHRGPPFQPDPVDIATAPLSPSPTRFRCVSVP